MEYLDKSMMRSDFQIGLHFKADDGKTGPVIVSTEVLNDVFNVTDDYVEGAARNAYSIGVVAEQKYDGKFPVVLAAEDFDA